MFILFKKFILSSFYFVPHFQLVDDTNKAGNDPNKNAISNNNQPLLITAADLLQTSHPVKWANKMVDERMKKDDKNSVKRRGGMWNIGPKWATFNSAKNKTSTEVQKLANIKIPQEISFVIFWRHDNVSYFNFCEQSLTNTKSS